MGSRKYPSCTDSTIRRSHHSFFLLILNRGNLPPPHHTHTQWLTDWFIELALIGMTRVANKLVARWRSCSRWLCAEESGIYLSQMSLYAHSRLMDPSNLTETFRKKTRDKRTRHTAINHWYLQNYNNRPVYYKVTGFLLIKSTVVILDNLILTTRQGSTAQ